MDVGVNIKNKVSDWYSQIVNVSSNKDDKDRRDKDKRDKEKKGKRDNDVG